MMNRIENTFGLVNRSVKGWVALKVVNIIITILGYLVFIVLLLLAAGMLFFGIRLYGVQTGSMEPNYPVGAMLVVEPVEFEDLREGDVITFSSGDSIVTHRIIAIDRQKQQLTTKGDNNNVADGSELHFSSVKGKVTYCIPKLGYAVLFLNTLTGKIVAAVVIIAIAGVSLIVRMYRSPEEEEEEEKEEPAEKA